MSYLVSTCKLPKAPRNYQKVLKKMMKIANEILKIRENNTNAYDERKKREIATTKMYANLRKSGKSTKMCENGKN